MRFLSFVSEAENVTMKFDKIDDIANFILHNCSEYFDQFYPHFLYRGIKEAKFGAAIITPRLDRVPLNTPQELQDVADAWFLKKFGWKARSPRTLVL